MLYDSESGAKMNKKDTKKFFDDLIRKVENMTCEDFQKIEREKSDF